MEEKVIFAPKTVKIKGGEILTAFCVKKTGRSLLLRSKLQGWGTTTGEI